MQATTEEALESKAGVKVVGAPEGPARAPRRAPRGPRRTRPERRGATAGRSDVGTVEASHAEGRSEGADRWSPLATRRSLATWAGRGVAVAAVVAALLFGLAWSGLAGQNDERVQATAAANRFLVALTNFKPATVDRDFGTITGMATGPFASQAAKFFNSAIRGELERALAQSQGQVRNLYVQTLSGGQASLFAVVDQVYVNSKVSTPQSDVLRLVLDLSDTASGWKVSNVSVLEGPSPVSGPSTGSASG